MDSNLLLVANVKQTQVSAASWISLLILISWVKSNTGKYSDDYARLNGRLLGAFLDRVLCPLFSSVINGSSFPREFSVWVFMNANNDWTVLISVLFTASAMFFQFWPFLQSWFQYLLALAHVSAAFALYCLTKLLCLSIYLLNHSKSCHFDQAFDYQRYNSLTSTS